jgi:hypothetical protein
MTRKKRNEEGQKVLFEFREGCFIRMNDPEHVVVFSPNADIIDVVDLCDPISEDGALECAAHLLCQHLTVMVQFPGKDQPVEITERGLRCLALDESFNRRATVTIKLSE